MCVGSGRLMYSFLLAYIVCALQGLVLDCSGLQWSSLDVFPTALEVSASRPDASPPVWLALDEVVDPQNFGAIVRSAHCLGVAGILACSRNCAPLSAAVSKASAGTLEVCQCRGCFYPSALVGCLSVYHMGAYHMGAYDDVIC